MSKAVCLNDWRCSTLGDEVELAYGKSLPKPSRIAGDFPVYGSNGIVDTHSSWLVKAPGVIVGRKGSCGEVHFAQIHFWAIDTTYYVVPKKDHNFRFLFYFLKTFGLERMNTHSAVPGLNRDLAYQLECQIPPLPEQQKIAAVLSKIQKAIEIQDAILANVRELKKSMMNRLFTHGLRDETTKDTDLGPVPSSWTVKKCLDYVTLQRGQDLRRDDFAEGDIPVIGATQILGYHNSANVKGPGVTVVRSGSSAGFAQFVECDFWAHNVVLYVKDFHGNDQRYVSYHLNHIDLSRFRGGVAVPTLNRNTFASLTTGVPGLAEQIDIASILHAIDTKASAHESKKSALQDLFKTTLNQLMTGTVRVKDLDIDTSAIHDQHFPGQL